MIRATILIVFLMVAFANAGPATQTVSASVKDTSINGVEGLNIKWSVPFEIQNYKLGFKYSLGDLKKVPDSLFAKRSFETSGDGVATVDAEYNLGEKSLNVDTDWVSDKLGLTLKAAGNTRDHLTKVFASTTQTLQGTKVTVGGEYDRLANKIDVTTTAALDDLTAEIKYDTKDKDPVLSVAYNVDSNNVITPSVSLKDGEVSYRWKRALTGGSIDTKFNPGNNVEVEWTDNGSNGVWKTKADIPVNDHAATKISFSREWNY